MTSKETKDDLHQMKPNEVQSIEADPTETTCGVGTWRPEWLQFFASPKFFVINFSLVAILQGANFTYLIGAMSTLEKRFAFESKVSGFILIADNLSQMIISPIIGYLGTRYNRPRIIAVGEILVALSCIMCSLPYFIYGPGLSLISNSKIFTNVTQYEVCAPPDEEIDCNDGTHSTVVPAVVILWLASFVNGMGYTAFYTIGLPYIDDNVRKKNSPLYLSTLLIDAVLINFYTING